MRSALHVEVGGDRLDVVDWSPGGLGVSSLPPALPISEEVPVRVSVVVEDVSISFDAWVKVVRVGPVGGVSGLVFAALPPPARDLLHHLAEASLQGESVSLTSVLDRVQPTLVQDQASAATSSVPPGPALGTPLSRSRAMPAAQAASWRPPARSIPYVVVGVLLTAYLVHALYERVWRIEVDAASLVAPTARIVSPADGVIRELPVAAGDWVAAGEQLFRVESPSVQAAIERAALEASQAEVRVAELEAMRKGRQVRLSIHGRMVRTRMASERAQVTLLEERLAVADDKVGRLQELQSKGVVTDLELQDMRSERARLAGQLAQVRGSVFGDQRRLGAVRHGYYVDGDRIEEGLPEIDAALASARADAELKKSQLEARRAHADASEAGRAPFSGRVAEVLQTVGTPVRQGSLVLVVEEGDERLVEAWLTRQEAEYVRIGDVARVAVASLGHEYDGVVRSIDTRPEAVAHIATAGETPRLQVLLELQGYADEPQSRVAAMAALGEVDAIGLPAIVSFSRSWR